MKASDMEGKRGRVVVNDTPCVCRVPGTEPLTETIEGTFIRLWSMPAGGMGIIEDDQGRRYAFDSTNDPRVGRIEIEVFMESDNADDA